MTDRQNRAKGWLSLHRAMELQPNQIEYFLFYRERLGTNDIAAMLGIPEHEVDRRRLQQARDLNAKHRTSRVGYEVTDCQGENPRPKNR